MLRHMVHSNNSMNNIYIYSEGYFIHHANALIDAYTLRNPQSVLIVGFVAFRLQVLDNFFLDTGDPVFYQNEQEWRQ